MTYRAPESRRTLITDRSLLVRFGAQKRIQNCTRKQNSRVSLILTTISRLVTIAKSNDLITTRHPGESRVLRGTGAGRYTSPMGLKSRLRRDWIPASAGMTVSGYSNRTKLLAMGIYYPGPRGRRQAPEISSPQMYGFNPALSRRREHTPTCGAIADRMSPGHS